MDESIESLWLRAKNRGLTYKKVAPMIAERFCRKCSPNTVQGLIKRGEGGETLERHVRLVLEDFLEQPDSVVIRTTKSVDSPVELHDVKEEYLTIEEWKRRAKKAESDLHSLRSGLKSLLELSNQQPPPGPKST